MNVRVFTFLALAVGLAACAGTGDYRSKKTIRQGLDYGMYTDYETATQFPTGPLDAPSVLDGSYVAPEADLTQPQSPSQEEDFTAELPSGSYSTYGDVAIPVASKKFRLGASATQKEMGYFQRALDQAYSRALRSYRPTGFTYSVSGVGSVNPLSDIEVSCMLSEDSANSVGQKTCKLFFQEIGLAYAQLLQEAN
ncbi:hypothetical protein [Candidatus Avelusimicrobium faecicola]|uniref:hypothetical protein n=1 Tax=Candidatus Avelusimicrobium faecicola TaxID=3416205 RepID=UPI003D108527